MKNKFNVINEYKNEGAVYTSMDSAWRNAMKLNKMVVPIIACLVLIFTNLIAAATEVDWGKVEANNIKVFYPGVASWEYLKDQDHGTGAAPVKTIKKACVDCHVGDTGEYDINSDSIISGELQKAKSKDPLEPQPIAGAKGLIDVAFQVAYDAENIYMRFQWPGSGASVADPALAKDHKADRLSIQIADKIKTFRMYGCFITCHDDQEGMPENRGAETHLYAYYSRDKKGNLKPQDKLDGYVSKGQFMDLWEASFAGSEVRTEDMYVLDDRHEDQNDLTATGGFENGTYTLVITRKLATGDAKDIVLSDGGKYSIGVAIHDDKNEGRKHYTSFPVSIGLSTAADISALKF